MVAGTVVLVSWLGAQSPEPQDLPNAAESENPCCVGAPVVTDSGLSCTPGMRSPDKCGPQSGRGHQHGGVFGGYWRWEAGNLEAGSQEARTTGPRIHWRGPQLGLGMSVAQRASGSQGWGHLRMSGVEVANMGTVEDGARTLG